MTWADIDAVVIGKAPDFFEGVMMPELYLADALGAVGKPHAARPHRRLASAARPRSSPPASSQAGVHARVLTVAFEKQSESEAMWALSLPIPFQPPLRGRRRRLLRPAHPRLHAPLRRARPHRHPGRAQGPPQRAEEPLRPPARARHHPREGPGLADAVGPDPLLRDLPVVRRRVRDGAHRRGRAATPPPTAGVGARRAMRSEPTMFAGRDQVNPQAGADCAADVYRQAGITDPRREIDVVEIYVPFSWYEPMWLENLGFAERGRGLEARRGRASPSWTATCRSTRRAACCRPTRSAPRA